MYASNMYEVFSDVLGHGGCRSGICGKLPARHAGLDMQTVESGESWFSAVEC